MEYMHRSANSAPNTMAMPTTMSMPMANVPPMTLPAHVNAPFPNVAPAYMGPVEYGHDHCCVKPSYSPVGIILVLFILLVIISRPCKF